MFVYINVHIYKKCVNTCTYVCVYIYMTISEIFPESKTMNQCVHYT